MSVLPPTASRSAFCVCRSASPLFGRIQRFPYAIALVLAAVVGAPERACAQDQATTFPMTTGGVTSSTIALGRHLITITPTTGTTNVTSTGLYSTTASGSLGNFSNSTGNGLTLTLNSGSANFAGGLASQTAGYQLGGTVQDFAAGVLSVARLCIARPADFTGRPKKGVSHQIWARCQPLHFWWLIPFPIRFRVNSGA